MTSQERHELRYQRRKAKREEKKIERAKDVGTLNEVFAYDKLYQSGKRCCNGVRWKSSTEIFEQFLFSRTSEVRKEVLDGTWEPLPYHQFELLERGVPRIIDAPHIKDRQVHKILTKNVLLPLYTPHMIYNNGASLKGKGLYFAWEMLKEELRDHYRRYGREGWIINIDFRHFFPSASHEIIKERHKRYVLDDRIRTLLDKIVDSVDDDKGMPLGLEISQAEMIAYTIELDNYIKCQLGLKGAGHYMDDYYVLVPPNMNPNDLLDKIVAKATPLGLSINLKKTKITPLDRSFKYCKLKYRLSENGRVYMTHSSKSMHGARQKMKLFSKKYKCQDKKNHMSLEDVCLSLQSYFAYYGKYNDHQKYLKLNRMFYSLFGFSFKEAREMVKREKREMEEMRRCNISSTDATRGNASLDM